MKHFIKNLTILSAIFTLTAPVTAVATTIGNTVISGSATSQSSGYISFVEEIPLAGNALINNTVSVNGLNPNDGISIYATLQCRGFSKAAPGNNNIIPCFNAGATATQELVYEGNEIAKVRVTYSDFTNNPYVVSVNLNYQVQATYFDRNAVAVYEDNLTRGAQNYLLTGDGQHVYTAVDFNSPEGVNGSNAIAITANQDAGQGTHWKLMLFANGSSAAASGIDLTGKKEITFFAKANHPVQLKGAFGCADDSTSRAFPTIALTTVYQKITLNIAGLNLSDVNTFLWVALHKDSNPISFNGITVYLDNITVQ